MVYQKKKKKIVNITFLCTINILSMFISAAQHVFKCIHLYVTLACYVRVFFKPMIIVIIIIMIIIIRVWISFWFSQRGTRSPYARLRTTSVCISYASRYTYDDNNNISYTRVRLYPVVNVMRIYWTFIFNADDSSWPSGCRLKCNFPVPVRERWWKK